MKNLVLFFLLFVTLTQAQKFEYQTSIGFFLNASSFYITANGLIYVTDSDKDEIVMLDTLGNEIKSFGGYGWSDNSFDDPADIFADPLSIYVADKNNHAIKRFDKNLNFISSLYKRESENSEEQFGYPKSCATSNQGDLYFIDSENNRLMKFDIFGNFISSFGGIDAGKYQLNKPKQLAINSSNNIFVIDENNIVVFDHFGNGISKTELNLDLKSIRILFDQMVVCFEKELYFSDLNSSKTILSKLELLGIEINKINSAILFNSMLYVLTDESILIFNKII
jgi:DNA-binding beta-propeller fold protein YncE